MMFKKNEVHAGIHPSNVELWKRLNALKDANGKYILKTGYVREYVRVVAGFDKNKGCYLSNENMFEKTGNLSEWLCKRHEKYMQKIGILTITRSMNGNKMVKCRRLSAPQADVEILPHSEFNKQYEHDKQAKKGAKAMENPSNLGGTKFELRGAQNLSSGGHKTIPQAVKEVITTTEENNHLKSSFTVGPVEWPAEPAFEVGQTAGRPAGEASPRSGEVDFVSVPTNNKQPYKSGEECVDELGLTKGPTSEPILVSKKLRATEPKTRKASMIENQKKAAAGHCVSPLGNPTRGRQMRRDPRALQPTGAVTTPNLWNHLINVYDTAFGGEHAQMMLSNDKSGFEVMTSELLQKFLDLRGANLTNRDLADYFSWFFDPERCKTRAASRDKSKSPLPHMAELKGHVNLIAFYDKVLKQKKSTGAVVAETTEAATIKLRGSYVENAFKNFRQYREDDVQTALCISRSGMVLYAIFLHDDFDKNESECKQRIIDVLVRFLRADGDREVLQNAMEATERNKALYDEDMSVFSEWATLCPLIIKTALEISGDPK